MVSTPKEFAIKASCWSVILEGIAGYGMKVVKRNNVRDVRERRYNEVCCINGVNYY
jgi:hypothetical protein